jgi:hypothetical protein
MVRPELGRGYDGHPRVIDPLGEIRGGDTQEGHLCHRGSTALGDLVPMDDREPRPLGFQENEKVRSGLCMLGGLTERGP